MQTFVLLLACIVATTLAQQYAVSITHADGSSINGADAVKKGNSIQYKFSLPNAGAGQLTSSCSSATRCYVRVVLTADIARDIGLSQCYLEWYYSTVSGTPTQDLADKIVTVYAKENYIAGGAVHTISAVVETNTQLFANQAQSVQVDTRDSTPSATCTIWGDPHYITFDATGALGQWDATYPIASHVIVAAPYRNFEIQSITKGWGPVEGGNAGVTCAFAAREGNDIVYFNFCTGQTDQGIYAVFNSPKDAQPTVFHSGIRYTINFRSGTQFSVDVNGGATGYLAGYVTVPGSDFKKGLFGACGNFDGDATNDVPTSTTGVRKGFGNNPTTQAQLEAVFGVIVKNYETNPRSLWNWQYDPRNVTVTSAAASECNPAPVSGPTVTTGGKDITALLLVQPGTSTTTTYDVPTDTLTYAALTAEQVQTLCHDKLAGSSLGQACLTSGAISQGAMDVHVQNCVVDIALTGGQASFITDAFLALQTDCLQHVYSGAPGFNFGAWTNANGGSFVCDSACSGNGECVNGVCVCNQGFANTDCSIDTTSTPSIDWISPVNFDVSQTSTFARIHGSAFWSDAAIKINGAAVSSFVYVDSFTVGINVLSAGFSAGDSASVAVTSGSGKTSNAVTITFYDGTCYSAPGVERTDVCFLTTGGCAPASSSECLPLINGVDAFDLADIVGGARRSAGSITFTATERSPGDAPYTWSVSNALTSINGGVVTGTGAAAWKAAGLDLDTYEWDNWEQSGNTLHTLVVSVQGQRFANSKTIHIYATEQGAVNRAPYYTGSSFSTSVPQTTTGLVASLDFSDPDTPSSHSFSYTLSGNSNFVVAGTSTGAEIRTKSGKDLCAALGDNVLTVTVSDGSASSTVTYTVTVTAANYPPSISVTTGPRSDQTSCLATGSVVSNLSPLDENTGSGAVVAYLSVTDRNSADSFSYFVSDTTHFAVVGNTVQTTQAFDYEAVHSFTFTLTVSDGSASSSAQVTLNINNVNDNAPSAPSTSNLVVSVYENTVAAVGSFSSTDADNLGALSFSIVGSNSPFSINAQSGAVTVSNLDYEAAHTASFTVRASDGVFNTDATFTINVLDQNDNNPVAVYTSSFNNVDENTPNVILGNFASSTDADTQAANGGALTVSAVGTCSAFTISGYNIVSQSYDYEALSAAKQVSCTFIVSDNAHQSQQVTVTVNVNNVDEAPTAITVSRGISESEAAGASVTLAVVDVDTPDASYTLQLANGSTLFALSGKTLSTKVQLDYETATSYTLSFLVRNTNNVQFTLSAIVNVLDAPMIVYLGADSNPSTLKPTVSIAQINAAGAAVGTVYRNTGFDFGTQTFSLGPFAEYPISGAVDVDDSALFTATQVTDSTSGLQNLKITAKNAITFAASKVRVNLVIKITTVGGTRPVRYQRLQLIVSNSNTALTTPLFNWGGVNIASGTPANTVIYTITAANSAGRSLTYTLQKTQPYTSPSAFAIATVYDSATNTYSGVVSTTTTASVNQYFLYVSVSDAVTGDTFSGDVIVQIFSSSASTNKCKLYNDKYGFVCPATKTAEYTACLAEKSNWLCSCTTGSTITQCSSGTAVASTAAASSVSAGTVAGIVVAIIVLVVLAVGIVLAITRSRRSGKTPIAISGVDSEGQAIVFNESSYTNSGEVAYDASAAAASEATVATWYHPRMSREECEDYLANLGEGAFVIRESTFTPGWHMMAVKTANTVVHERIKLNADGTFQMLPATNVSQPSFRTMSELVEFYSAGKHDGVAFSLALDNPMYDNHLLREQASMDAAHEPVAVPSTTEADAPLLPSRSGDL